MFRPFGSGGTTQPAPFGSSIQTNQPANTNTNLFNMGGGGSFGGGSSMLPSTGSFGSVSGGVGGSGFSSPAAPHPRYSTTTDTEGNVNITLTSITAMPAYQKYSFEELRLEDYLAGRKGSSSGPFGAVGQPVPSVFGSSATGTTQPTNNMFGSTPVATNPFGSGSTFGTSTTGGFGQPSTASTSLSSMQQPSGGLFGSAPAASSFGGFGQSQPTNTSLFGNQASSGGLFGNQASTSAAPTSAFGSNAFNKPVTTTGSTPFSFNSATQSTLTQQQPFGTSGSLFGGQQSTSNTPSTTNLFGGQPATSTSVGGGGLFGANTFGSSAAQPQQQQPKPFSFGTSTSTTTPTTTSFFGQSQPTTTGAAPTFGTLSQTAATPAPSTSTGGMFSFGSTNTGAASTQQPSNLNTGFSFGATAAPTAPTGSTSLFGSSLAQQPQPQQSSLLSTAPSTGFNFSLTPAATATPAPSSFNFGNYGASYANTSVGATPAASSNLPLISPDTFSIKPPLPQKLTASSKTADIPKSATSATTPITQRTSHREADHSFSGKSSSFRLTIPRNTLQRPLDSGIVGQAPIARKSYAKKLEIEEVGNINSIISGTRLSRVSSLASLDDFGTENSKGNNDSSNKKTEIGEKYMIPSEATLRKLPYAQLCAIKNFTIGEKGIGQIRFLEPVDLTKICLSDIFARIAVFEPMEVTLYPDEEFDEDEKPQPGFALNLPAEVRIEGCWQKSKADRQPIKDMGDSRLQAYVEKLRTFPDTHFVDYIPESGTWIFRVDHF